MNFKRVLSGIGCSIFAVVFFSTHVYSEDLAYKADFIIKLIDYVQWTGGAGTDGSGTVNIGVVGQSPILQSLKTASEGKKITVKTITPEDPLTDFQILFITTKDKTELAKALKKISGKPVLTVSDCTGFAGFGVMINFYSEDGTGKVKFEANTLAAGDAGLKISSQLLKLAKII